MTSRFASLSALAALLANLIGAPLCAAGLEGEPASAQLTGTVVVVNQAADTVTLIDVATMEAYRHVPVVGGPHEVAISPDGRRAIVTNYRKRGVGPQKALSLISLPDGAVLKTIDLGKYRAPHDVHWVNGSQVVCTVEDNQALLLVNVESGAVEDPRAVLAEMRAAHTTTVVDEETGRDSERQRMNERTRQLSDRDFDARIGEGEDRKDEEGRPWMDRVLQPVQRRAGGGGVLCNLLEGRFTSIDLFP